MTEVQLTGEDQLKIVGSVQRRVGGQLIVQADALVRPLDEGYSHWRHVASLVGDCRSMLFTMEGTVVGQVADIFGCVNDPLYLVNTRKAAEMSEGTKLYCTDRYSVYVDLSSQVVRTVFGQSTKRVLYA